MRYVQIDTQSDPLSESFPSTENFHSHLESLGAKSQYQVVEGPRIWTEDPDKALVPQQVLQAIMNWITT